MSLITRIDNNIYVGIWQKRLRLFAYVLLILKLVEALGWFVSGPIYIKMNHIVNQQYIVKLGVIIYLTGALSALLLLLNKRVIALGLLLISGSMLFVHYVMIHKAGLLNLCISYWESVVLAVIYIQESRSRSAK